MPKKGANLGVNSVDDMMTCAAEPAMLDCRSMRCGASRGVYV